MSKKVYVGDIGTAIILDCVEDISTATARTIEVQRPDGSTISWNASASGTTMIRFETIQGTFDQAGIWKLQAKVILPSGQWRGATVKLVVYPAFG